MQRTKIIDQFLIASGFAGAKRTMLAGDASFRKYERILCGEKTMVLMDAPPEKEDVKPFVKITELLQNIGLNSPQIIACDIENGLLLLEDFGDALFARILEKNPEQEAELYLAASEVLIKLYDHAKTASCSQIPPFDLAKQLTGVALLPQWFYPLATGGEIDERLNAEYLSIWSAILKQMPDLGNVIALGDFHAENLIYLPERQAPHNVGLLDFQDAMLASPAYDVVSFLQDARRDVNSQTAELFLEHYLAQTGIDKDQFMTAYAITGGQRNIRIVGTFARLAVRDGKQRYLDLLPRVWQHVNANLAHPIFEPLKEWLDCNIKPEIRVISP